jgi:hypothetical protein
MVITVVTTLHVSRLQCYIHFSSLSFQHTTLVSSSRI